MRSALIQAARIGKIIAALHLISVGYSDNPLQAVRSFEYALATNSQTQGFYVYLANSPVDMIITGGGAEGPLDRAKADPSGTKIILGYVDIAEAASYSFPSLFSGTLPSWFGHQNPGYTGLYSVQYWNPNWEPQVFGVIDAIVRDGYDGVFLDVCDADLEWSTGNSENNPVYSDAVGAMGRLIADIRTHVAASFPGKKVLLLGNNPAEVALQHPQYLRNLDGIFNEWIYYGQSASNGLISEYKGTTVAQWTMQTLAPAYAASGLPVFGNDYPVPLSSRTSILPGFTAYAGLGWTSSITNAWQGFDVFNTGPFLFTATSSRPQVQGTAQFVNYLAAGTVANATLIGGPLGDTFVGGPGHNVINAGIGNDLIYAHAASIPAKGLLQITVGMTLKGTATQPRMSVLVNGSQAMEPAAVTAAYGVSSQTFTLDVGQFGTLKNLVLVIDGTSYGDANNFSNVELLSVVVEGTGVDLSKGTYSNGWTPQAGTYYYSNNGTISFGSAAIPAPSTTSQDTSDVIDGGAGSDTVVYGGARSNYDLRRQADGTWSISAQRTAEGPDTLRNVEQVQFSDYNADLTTGDASAGPARLTNLSVRAMAGAQTLTAGFFVGGSGTKNALIRGDGPSLAGFGVGGVLPDPVLKAYNASQQVVASNAAWGGSAELAQAFTAVGAFAFPANSRDTALISALSPGGYSMAVSSATGDSGVALLEVYDLDSVAATTRFVNVSALTQAGNGAAVLTAGFVVSGSGYERLLIRGIGPSLSAFGVNGALALPVLTLYDRSGNKVATSTGWSSPAVRGASPADVVVSKATAADFDAVYAFPIAAGSADSAMVVTVPPGLYSAQITSVDGSTGTALMEVYER